MLESILPCKVFNIILQSSSLTSHISHLIDIQIICCISTLVLVLNDWEVAKQDSRLIDVTKEFGDLVYLLGKYLGYFSTFSRKESGQMQIGV
jgi:hypothetical protein